MIRNVNGVEQEIVSYLKIGLMGRAKQYERQTAPVPHLDIVLNFMPISEMSKFGSHICNYYTFVTTNKKLFYEEFSSLLATFNFISLQFQIYSPVPNKKEGTLE